MMKEWEEALVPLFEFFGIPMIILTPLCIILFILFKFVFPKMLANNRSTIGLLVAKIVAHLFGEGDGTVKGVEELDVVKIFKSLPLEIQNEAKRTNDKLNKVTHLMALMSQAMMGERLIKPQTSRILTQIVKEANEILSDADEFLDATTESNETEEIEETQDANKVEV